MISVFFMLNTEKVILKDVQIHFFLSGSYKKHVWCVEAKSWWGEVIKKKLLCAKLIPKREPSQIEQETPSL